MTAQATDTSVTTSIVVEAPIETAFAVFTDDMASWWPPGHHILEGELKEMVFEARAGGRVFDRGVDGSECAWARVLAYEPPNRVVLSWDINLEWQLETDSARASEVEVRFVAESPTRTRVELEHRHLDRHGPGWPSLRDGVADEQGWPLYLARFEGLLHAA